MKLHRGQTKAFLSKARFVLAVAGTGGGKSFMGPPWLAREISLYPQDIWMVVAPTYKILHRATLPELIRSFKGTTFEGEYLSSQGIYKLPDGGMIYCLSADNPDSLQGGQIRGVWFDEAGMMPDFHAWVACQQRLGVKQGRCLLTSTPYGHPWLYDLIKNDSGDYDYINWRSIDNPYYPKEEYYRAARELPRWLFDMRYNGVFGTPEHAVFPDFADDNVTEVEYDPDLPILVGSDFNISPLHWVLGQKHDQTLHIYDEVYIPYAAKTQDALDELYQRHSNHKSQFYFFGDATSKAKHTSASASDYAQIANDARFISMGRHLRYPDSNPIVIDRIAAMQAMIKSNIGDIRLLISPKAKHLIEDIKRTRYIEGTRVIDKKGYDPHGVDALGYIISQVWPIRHKLLTQPQMVYVSKGRQ